MKTYLDNQPNLSFLLNPKFYFLFDCILVARIRRNFTELYHEEDESHEEENGKVDFNTDVLTVSSSCEYLLKQFVSQLLLDPTNTLIQNDDHYCRYFRILNIYLKCLHFNEQDCDFAAIHDFLLNPLFQQNCLCFGSGAIRINIIGNLSKKWKEMDIVRREKLNELITNWWLEIHSSTSSNDIMIMKHETKRATNALTSLLCEETLLHFVEKSLRDNGPVGTIHFTSLLEWFENYPNNLGEQKLKDSTISFAIHDNFNPKKKSA